MGRGEVVELIPLVASVCGYVVAGAEIVFVTLEGTRKEPESTLILRPAGEWFEIFRGRRFSTGRGRPWSIVGWSRYGPDPGWKTRQPR